jgi:CHAD domain-containing protein
MAYRFAVATIKTSQVNPAMLTARLLSLLEKIPHDAGEEDVHRLRTTVRRLEVQLNNPPARVAKSLRTLRRRAGKLRDIDVHLGLLKPPLPSLAPARRPRAGLPGARPAPLDRAQQKLRQMLRARRARQLVSLRHRVAEAAPLLAASLPALAARAVRSPAAATDAHQQTARARRRFLRWTRILPADAVWFHRLRIRAKKLRYSLEPLELHGEAAELTAQLKQVQDAIGCWHDWATLQQRALEAFDAPHRTPDSAHLCAALRARAALQYRQARHIVRSVRASLVGARPAASATSKHAPQTLIRKVG